MTMLLWLVVATVVLSWTLIMADATPGLIRNGMAWGMGNREGPPQELTGVSHRIRRSNLNLQENLPLFVALALVAHVSGQANATTVLGAQIFFGARVAHAGVFIAGFPGVRTAIWGVSIAGMGMMVASLM